jgi:hypothetical protein
MARKVVIHRVPADAENRDKGRQYVLTEMSATDQELWAARVFFAMAKGGIEIPDDIKKSGMSGLSRFATELVGKLNFDDAQILLGELFTCVQFIPDNANPSFFRPLVESDIEELSTRLVLRKALLELHFSFIKAAFQSILAGAKAAEPSEGSLSTPTSP